MLSAVCQVSQQMAKQYGLGVRHSLETISKAVEAWSPIDEIIYASYDTDPSNPIWGQFLKYGRSPGVYATSQTVVEVRYAKHLDTNWRRFVVCKELCHALDVDEGTHSASDRAIDRLLNKFALMSAGAAAGKSFAAYDAEILAEVGAIELLCPHQYRRSLVTNGGVSREEELALCAQFGIPDEYAWLAFGSEYIKMVETLA